jgi:hypothetical protein
LQNQRKKIAVVNDPWNGQGRTQFSGGTMSSPAPSLTPIQPKPKNVQRGGTAIVLALIVAAIYLVGSSAKLSAASAWVLTFGLLTALCLYLGWAISQRPLGILVGSRNLMSLSRFQMVAWSVVVLSAFLTIAFRRIFAGVTNPLDIAMDEHLLALLGISTASLVGTPLILQGKAAKDTSNAAVQKTAAALNEPAADVQKNREGNLYANSTIQDARVTDMFEGDEVGNTAYLDIAKVQMFLFTMVAIVAYCSQIYHAFGQVGASHEAATIATLSMPVLSQGLIVLLGISHAGYLGSKTADHTPTTTNP